MNTPLKTGLMLLIPALMLGGIWLKNSSPNDTGTSTQASAPNSPPDQTETAQIRPTKAPEELVQAEQSQFGSDLPHSPLPPGFNSGDPAVAWAKVDLEALKADMPNNLYWVLAAPTKDEQVLAERREIKEYWDKQRAQINANRASEKQIRDYFQHREQVTTDYIEFATSLLNRYHDVLPEEAYSFQVFARNLNLVLLQELPKKLNNALESRKKFIAQREEWLQDKQAYEAKLAQERQAALRELGKI